MTTTMSKKDWVIVLATVPAIFLLDQLTKVWAVNILGNGGYWNTNMSFLGFFLHKNYGAMLGTFSHLPPILRIVSLSTGGAFLIFIYAIIMKLLQHRLLVLRIGLSILLGGILGNVFDRIVSGGITDFIVLRAFSALSPAFNLADAFQWIGYFCVAWSLIKHGHLIWHDDEKRNSLWVDKTYQLKYCFMLLSFSFLFSVILGVFSFTFLKVVLSEATHKGVELQGDYLGPFVFIFSIITVAFMITLFLVGLRLSHRSVGPVHAFRIYLKDLRKGQFRELQLRSLDEFKYLQNDAKALREDYQALHQAKIHLKDIVPEVPEDEDLSLSAILKLLK